MATYYKTPQGAYLTIKEGKITSPAGSELQKLKAGTLSSTAKTYADVSKIAATPVTAAPKAGEPGFIGPIQQAPTSTSTPTGGAAPMATTTPPGTERITIPKWTAGSTEGTLSGIAAKYGSSVEELMRLNPQIKDPDLIYAGYSLNVPTAAKAGTALVAPEAGVAPGVKPEIGIEEEEPAVAVTSEEARRKKIEEDVAGKFGEIGVPEKPALPTFEADFEALRSEKGMEAIETRMTGINDEIRQLEDQTRADLRDEEGRLRPMSLISIHQQEIVRDRQEQIDALIRSKAVLVDEYNTKASVINQTMTLKQMDYAAATADYNTSFSQAIQIQNLIEGRITSELQRENMVRDDARANLSVVTKAIVDSGKSWSDLNPELQATMKTLELKAGLPSGVIEAFMLKEPGMTVDYVTSGYNAAGNQVTSFFSYNNGDPKLLKSIATGAVKGGGEDGITLTEEMADARAFIAANPDATYEDLDVALRAGAEKMTDADIESLFKAAGKTPTKIEEETLTVADSIQQLKDEMNYSRKEAKEYITTYLEKEFGEGKIPKEIENAIEDALVVTYGRTFGQKFWPWGR